MAEAAYTAKDITVLEGLEPVRLRPGMYIGSTGSRGLHHLVFEVVDNSVDEAMAGRADEVEVTLHPDNSVTVTDNGSGIPTDVMKDQGLPAVTASLGVASTELAVATETELVRAVSAGLRANRAVVVRIPVDGTV